MTSLSFFSLFLSQSLAKTSFVWDSQFQGMMQKAKQKNCNWANDWLFDIHTRVLKKVES